MPEKDKYGSFRGGSLNLKGGMMMKKKKRKKEEGKEARGTPDSAAASASAAAEGAGGEDDVELQVLVGSGRISSSGTTVHGHEQTRFMVELSVGDALIIKHPTTHCDETRIVKMVLSDLSISISSPFSSDLSTTTTFRYIKAPKDEQPAADAREQKRAKHAKEEKSAFGTYASEGGTKFVYRTKKGGVMGGYYVVEENLDAAATRETLLEKRCKMKADRHCG